MAVLKRVCDDTPRPLREVNQEVPDYLAAIIARLHARSPAERYQSAAEVAELLGRHLTYLQQPGSVRPSRNTSPKCQRRDTSPKRQRREGGSRRFCFGLVLRLFSPWELLQSSGSFRGPARTRPRKHDKPGRL